MIQTKKMLHYINQYLAKTNGFTLLGREFIYCSNNLHRCENQFMQTSSQSVNHDDDETRFRRQFVQEFQDLHSYDVPSEKSEETCRT